MRLGWLLIFILATIALLKWQFPYAVSSSDDWAHLIYLLMFLVLVAGGWSARRLQLSQAVKYGLIWLALILGLVLGYSYREQLHTGRFLSELMPGRVRTDAQGSMTVRRSEDGHFHVVAQVNDATVDFIVDTGASDIMLTAGDAERAGFDPVTLNYRKMYQTANGVARGAPVRLKTLVIDSLVQHDVPASVGSAGGESLLGMAFLDTLKSYSIDGNTLTLRP